MGNEGFTLLEVMVAMAIMLLAFSSILSVESNSINSTQRARQMNVVAMLAKNTMIETEYKIEGKPFDEVKKEDGGTFAAPYQDYRWVTQVKEIEFPSLPINAAASAAGGGAASGNGAASGDLTELVGKLITKFLSKAAREVTVTILWKKGSGEQSFSVSTYWVDLNHEFQFTP